MSDEELAAQIQAFAFGELSSEEQRALLREALEDQTLFDELWDAADDREVVQDPITRNRLLRVLQERHEQPLWRVAWAWLTLPASRVALVGAVAVFVAIFIWRGSKDTRQETAVIKPTTIVTDSNSDLARFFILPRRNDLSVKFELNHRQAIFHVGEVIHGSVELRQPAAVFILRRPSEGDIRIVFPAELSASADLNAGTTPVIFDPVPPTAAIGTRQRVTLRIIVLPVGRDLRTQSIEWERLGAYSVQEVTYDVEP